MNPVALAPLSDLGSWARGNGLEALLVLVGTALVTRVVRWVGHRVEGRIDESQSGDVLVRSERAKHRHAMAQVLTYGAVMLLWTIAGILVLQRLGVPVSGLAAPAAALGVAFGLGAQRFVQDILAGFFVVTERQYGYGDVIRLSLGSGIAPLTGTVEDVTLRVTTMRTLDGEVVITPNGQIMQVTNLSRDWARAVIDVPVPTGVDVSAVSDVLVRVGEHAYDDPTLHDLLLDAPSVMGVESLQRDQLNIRVVARTLPGQQFEVGRRLRRLIATALRDHGVVLAPQLDTAVPSGQA